MRTLDKCKKNLLDKSKTKSEDIRKYWILNNLNSIIIFPKNYYLLIKKAIKMEMSFVLSLK